MVLIISMTSARVGSDMLMEGAELVVDAVGDGGAAGGLVGRAA
jgi:hypothetical protein